MNELHSLTVRTTAALGRLAELQRRAGRASAGSMPVTGPALKELSAALEELKVATEQLQLHSDELLAARMRAEQAASRLGEFVNVLPMPCLWTDEGGVIREANQAAADLLNVARLRLAGKPLMLFIGERQRFFDALAALKAAEDAAVDVRVVIRPRERRPRAARFLGCRLQSDPRWCWFVTAEEPAPTDE